MTFHSARNFTAKALSIFVLLVASFGVMFAQRITEKSLLLKSGDLVEIENIKIKNLISLKHILNNKYNDIFVDVNSENGKVFVETVPNAKGKRVITIEHKNLVDGDTIVGYRVYDLNFVPSLITANDDVMTWDGNGERIIDILSNDIFTNGIEKVLINYVTDGFNAQIVDNNIHVSSSQGSECYIQYTILDSLGGSDQAVVTLKPVLEFDSNKTFRFYLNYANTKTINIPFGYNISSFPINGQLNEIGSQFYLYTPQSYFVGKDSFEFVNNDGLKVTYLVTILDAVKDPGLIKDDVIYTPANKPVEFNVLENDLINDIEIADISYLLTNLGNGNLRYDGGNTGVRNYYYNANTLVGQETGRIKINVSNYAPDNINYNVTILENTVYSLDYNVPITGYSFNVSKAPSHGNIDFYMNETAEMNCGKGLGKYMIIYKPQNGFVGNDEVSLDYCIDGSNCKTVTLKFTVVENPNSDCGCINNCVYPGDLDGDGRVSAADILVLGRYMGAVGPKRAKENNAVWVGEQALPWGIKNTKGYDLMHADANGDGVLDQKDISYINTNYGKVKGFVPKPPLGFKDFPFDIIAYPEVVDSGETQTLYFVLGSEDIPANAIHGMSFQLNLGAIDSSSFKFELYKDSWLTDKAPSESIAHQVSPGIINIGLTIAEGASIVGEENDGVKATGVSGHGVIAKASYIVGEENDGVRRISSRALATDKVIMEDLAGESFWLDNSKVNIRVNQSNPIDNAPVEVFSYPNPSIDKVIIASSISKTIHSVSLQDITGKTILQHEGNGTNEVILDISKQNRGIYLAKIIIDGVVHLQKIIKR
jgi:hypothetical protein